MDYRELNEKLEKYLYEFNRKDAQPEFNFGNKSYEKNNRYSF